MLHFLETALQNISAVVGAQFEFSQSECSWSSLCREQRKQSAVTEEQSCDSVHMNISVSKDHLIILWTAQEVRISAGYNRRIKTLPLAPDAKLLSDGVWSLWCDCFSFSLSGNLGNQVLIFHLFTFETLPSRVLHILFLCLNMADKHNRCTEYQADVFAAPVPVEAITEKHPVIWLTGRRLPDSRQS